MRIPSRSRCPSQNKESIRLKVHLSSQDGTRICHRFSTTRRFSQPDPTMKGANSSSFLSASSSVQLGNLAVLPTHAFLSCHSSFTCAIPREFANLRYLSASSRYSQPCLVRSLRRFASNPRSRSSSGENSTECLQFHQQPHTRRRGFGQLSIGLDNFKDFIERITGIASC